MPDSDVTERLCQERISHVMREISSLSDSVSKLSDRLYKLEETLTTKINKTKNNLEDKIEDSSDGIDIRLNDLLGKIDLLSQQLLLITSWRDRLGGDALVSEVTSLRLFKTKVIFTLTLLSAATAVLLPIVYDFIMRIKDKWK